MSFVMNLSAIDPAIRLLRAGRHEFDLLTALQNTRRRRNLAEPFDPGADAVHHATDILSRSLHAPLVDCEAFEL